MIFAVLVAHYFTLKGQVFQTLIAWIGSHFARFNNLEEVIPGSSSRAWRLGLLKLMSKCSDELSSKSTEKKLITQLP